MHISPLLMIGMVLLIAALSQGMDIWNAKVSQVSQKPSPLPSVALK